MFNKALTIQEHASKLGFDWPDAYGVLDKIQEEAEEIRRALDSADIEQARNELGDLLLASVNLSRFLSVSPDATLQKATERFEKRFQALQIELDNLNRSIHSCSLAELETIWQKVKVDFK